MSKKTSADLPPEDSLPKVRTLKKQPFATNFICPIDETEDFYDPFSDLSLFLAGKVKNELVKENNPKQWSKKIQDLLLQQILPEFNYKFPKYRLGVTALKKTWEKVRLYLDSIDEKKDALTPDGSLNVAFMIRENLKELLFKKSKTNLFPYNQAHQLAVKISECIATLEGTRTDLEEMSKTIWSLQKHLIIPQEEHHRSPYENYTSIDKFIARFQLEELACNPSLSEGELSSHIQKKLVRLGGLSRLKRLEDLTPGLWALLAEKIYPHLPIHKNLSQEKISSIEEFAKKQCLSSSETVDPIHLVKKISLLYRMASKMSKPLAEKQLEAAISYVLSLSSDRIRTEIPVLRQEVYTFIQYEIQAVKSQREESPLEKILQTLTQTFEEISHLPAISDQDHKDLEILVWKVIHQECNLLAKVPYYLRELIEEELVNVHIEHPEMPPQNLIHQALSNLKTMQTLPLSTNPLSPDELQSQAISQKIRSWSLQGDLICGWLHFDTTHCIGKTVKKLWKQLHCTESHVCHSDFISKVLSKITQDYPALSTYKEALQNRITIMYKHFWYTELRADQETSFDRFIKWHYIELTNEKQMQFHEMIIEHLDDICKNNLPLIPFHRDYVRSQTEGLNTRECNATALF